MLASNEPLNGLEMYYAQGVVVLVSGAGQAPPAQVLYQGGTICAHTAIVLDLTVSPPLLATAFSNAAVVNMTQSEWTEVQKSTTGTALDLIQNSHAIYADCLDIAMSLDMYFAGN
jgi:hypothetical protein